MIVSLKPPPPPQHPSLRKDNNMIDEKKLIDELFFKMPREYGFKPIQWFRQLIDNQPKVGEWMPFTMGEDGLLNCKLPEEDEEILVSGGGSVWEDTFMTDGEDCWLDVWGGDLIGLAWMPKPEPWEGEEE